MKQLAVLTFLSAFLALGVPAFADTYDAVGNYSCESANSLWHYEGYRHSDGAYLPMIYGHPMVTEFSKYGTEAFYLPDGDQEYYPFMTSFDRNLICSPATAGGKFDAVLGWESASDGDVTVSGYAKLLGNLKGTAAEGKKIKARLVLNGKTLWSDRIIGPTTKEFSVRTKIKSKDVVRLHIENDGDPSGNLAAINMHIETEK